MEDKVGTVQFGRKQQQLQDKAWSVSQKQEQQTKWKQRFTGNNFNSCMCTKWKQSSDIPRNKGKNEICPIKAKWRIPSTSPAGGLTR